LETYFTHSSSCRKHSVYAGKNHVYIYIWPVQIVTKTVIYSMYMYIVKMVETF